MSKMSPKFFIFLVSFATLTSIATADIFGDLLGWDIISTFTGGSGKGEESKHAAKKEDENVSNGCECVDGRCNCCVDFNITSIIDLGGPGCVRMRYISQDEGVTLNVSYGDSLLHSKVVKQNDKKGSCMDLLSEFAQICARFDNLRPSDDGLQGCLHFEPHVLGEVTSQYHIGCFKMGPDGMALDPSVAPTEENAEEPETQEEEEDDDDDSDETPSILDVVNQSAEQGIAFFSDLLGIKIQKNKNKSTTEKASESASTTPTPETEETDDEADDESRNFGSVKSSVGRSYLTNQVS